MFIGALSTGNRGNKSQSAAFSFLATLPAGILEIIPVTLVQLDANDVDLGTVFCNAHHTLNILDTNCSQL